MNRKQNQGNTHRKDSSSHLLIVLEAWVAWQKEGRHGPGAVSNWQPHRLINKQQAEGEDPGPALAFETLNPAQQ